MKITISDLYCEIFNRFFQRPTSLRSTPHLKTANQFNNSNSKICEKCNEKFMLNGYEKHYQTCKGKIRQICNSCDKQFTTISVLENHMEKTHNMGGLDDEYKNDLKILRLKENQTLSDIHFEGKIGEEINSEKGISVKNYIDHYGNEIKIL